MSQPNILFILADDLGWNDLGYTGSRFYESSNIDRIAREGVRFTQAYATCQVCSPSRASILTGKYPPRHGITDYLGAPTGEAWRDMERHTRLLPPDQPDGLRHDETTFVSALRDAGYRTFFSGKWHLGEEGTDPEDFGFETNIGGWSAGGPWGGYFGPWQNPRLEANHPGESLPIRLARETADFIQASQDTPFLAYLSFYSVHAPLQTSQDRWEKFRQKACAGEAPQSRFIFDNRLPVRQVQDNPVYAGMIEAMDEAVGIVLGCLDGLGLADNTLVIFTSDNGGVSSGDAFSSSMLPLRGGKGHHWEGGIRVPLAIRLPGTIEAETTNDTPVSGIDFYPTLLDLAGLEVPASRDIDGLSILPLLNGKDFASLRDRDLFWHYPHYGNQGGAPASSIRSGPWKLIRYYETPHVELHNLEQDPGEQLDLADQQPELASQLAQRLDRWLDETGATYPYPDPKYDVEKESAYLATRRDELMPELEAQHAQYLDPDWQPDEDWWGSQVVTD